MLVLTPSNLRRVCTANHAVLTLYLNLMNLHSMRYLVLCAILAFATRIQADIIGDAETDEDKVLENFESGEEQNATMSQARKSLLQNDLVVCRRLMKEAAAENPDMLHPDVIIAQWLMASGQPIKAQANLEEIAVEEPDRSDVRWLFAKFALRQGRLLDAWIHIDAAEKAHTPEEWSDEFSDLFRRAIIRTKAVTAVRREKPDVAIELYQQLLREKEQPSDILRLASIELRQGNSSVAEKLVRRACDSPDVVYSPELMLAKIHEQLNDSDDCESWYRKSIVQNGADANRARLHFARWLVSKNRAAEVKEVIDGIDATENVPSDPDFVVGLAERMLGNIETAGKLFVDLHERNPGNAAVNNQLALVLIETKSEDNHEVAKKLAKANAKFAPQSSEFAATLGWIYLRMGDLENANGLLTVATKQGKPSLDTLFYLSELRAKQGNDAQAEKLRNACRENPGEFFNKRRMKP